MPQAYLVRLKGMSDRHRIGKSLWDIIAVWKGSSCERQKWAEVELVMRGKKSEGRGCREDVRLVGISRSKFKGVIPQELSVSPGRRLQGLLHDGEWSWLGLDQLLNWAVRFFHY